MPRKARTPENRPTNYEGVKTDKKAYQLALLGLTEERIAELLDVTDRTIRHWKDEHPSFKKALQAGKDDADSKVAASLYKRACGFKTTEEKAFCFQGVVVKETVEVNVHPDVIACIFWLKNRQRHLWRDKIEQDLNVKDAQKMSKQEILDELGKIAKEVK